MKAVLAASVAILALGAATGVLADGDGGSDGASAPVIASDSGAAGDGWNVASSAGLTYAQTNDAGVVLNAGAGQTVLQNYQVLDPNVVELTQVVEGDTVTTLSGVMLQKTGDDTSDPAALDEAASGVYSSGSAGLVPSLYGGAGLLLASNVFVCASGCDLFGGAGGPSGSAAGGPVETLASYASNSTSSLLPPLTYSAPIQTAWLDSAFPIPAVGSLGGAYVPPLSYGGFPPLSPPPPPGGGDPPPGDPPGDPPGVPGNGLGDPGGGAQPADVPEPAAWALMIIGLGAVGAVRRRRAHAAPA